MHRRSSATQQHFGCRRGVWYEREAVDVANRTVHSVGIGTVRSALRSQGPLAEDPAARILHVLPVRVLGWLIFHYSAILLVVTLREATSAVRALCGGSLWAAVPVLRCGGGKGAEFAAMLPSWRPDLIWMDLRLPGMSGVETARKVSVIGESK